MKKFVMMLSLILLACTIKYNINRLEEIEKHRQQEEITKEEIKLEDDKKEDIQEGIQEDIETEQKAEKPKEMLPGFSEMHQENPDIVGWIQIDGARVNYPVMQTSSEDSEFYLHHGWKKEESSDGLPFLDSNCDLCNSENLFIFGHRMRNGSMFGDLKYYKEKNFFEEHQNVKVSSLYEDYTYQVIGVVQIQATSTNLPLLYELDTEESYNEYYSFIKNNSLYDTGVTASFGDKFITLITCDYDSDDGRLLVVAKRV